MAQISNEWRRLVIAQLTSHFDYMAIVPLGRRQCSYKPVYRVARRTTINLSLRTKLRGRPVPAIIARILDSNATWVLARGVLTFVFWSAGLGQLVTFNVSAAQMTALHLVPGAVFATIVPITLLLGSVMIVFDRMLWLGTGILSIFLVLTIPLVHPFWSMSGAHADDEMRLVFEHISVVGGLMVVAIASRQRSASPTRR